MLKAVPVILSMLCHTELVVSNQHLAFIRQVRSESSELRRSPDESLRLQCVYSRPGVQPTIKTCHLGRGQVIPMTVPGKTAVGCYALWYDDALEQGCWRQQNETMVRECSPSTCIDFIKRADNIRFCCCYGNRCNQHFSALDED